MYRVLGLPGAVVTASTTITPLNSTRDEVDESEEESAVIITFGRQKAEGKGRVRVRDEINEIAVVTVMRRYIYRDVDDAVRATLP
jgi:hypothetical protein